MHQADLTSGHILAKNVVINLLSLCIPIFVGIAAIPFAIKGLGTVQFGILTLLWVFLGYVGLLDFGLGRATTKLISESIIDEKVRVLPALFWTSAFASFVCGILGAFIIQRIAPVFISKIVHIPPELRTSAQLSFTTVSYALPFLLLSTTLKGTLSAVQKFALINQVQIPLSICNFLFPALSLPFGFGLPAVILLLTLSRIAGTFIYFVQCLRVLPGIRTVRIDFQTLKKLLSYGGWVTISSTISPILVYLDRFFIGARLSLNAVSFYTAPFEAIYRLRIIPIAFMTTFFPAFSLTFSLNSEKSGALFRKSTKYIFVMIGSIAVLCFCYAGDILAVWLGKSFAENSTLVFRIFCVGIVINSLAYVPFTFLQGIGRPDIPAKIHAVELLLYGCVLWFMTKQWGIQGAAAAWLGRISLDFFLLFAWIFRTFPNIKKIYRKESIWPEFFLIMGLGSCLFLTRQIINNLAVQLALTFGFIVLTGWIAWHVLLDTVEQRVIISIAQRKPYHPGPES
jgi:O-antigen/teichoic acid export membrane protein